jgi:hypothetical protein
MKGFLLMRTLLDASDHAAPPSRSPRPRHGDEVIRVTDTFVTPAVPASAGPCGKILVRGERCTRAASAISC